MIKKLISIVIVILFTINVSGQKWRHTWTEGLVGGGVGMLFSDIKGDKFKPMYQGGVRFKTGKYWTVKFDAYYSQFAGDDKGTEQSYYFNTVLSGLTMQLEYYLMVWNEEQIGVNKRGLFLEEPEWAVYTFLGPGLIYFDPEPGGDLINEPTDYKKLSIIVRGGLGGKYSLSKRITVGLEVGLNYPKSDYLEGYAPVDGTSDLIISGILSVGYKLNLSTGPGLMK